MHARANCLETWSSGGVISGGGQRGEHIHHWNIVHNHNQGQSLVSGQPLFGDWNQHHPIMSMLYGQGSRIKRKVQPTSLPPYLEVSSRSHMWFPFYSSNVPSPIFLLFVFPGTNPGENNKSINQSFPSPTYRFTLFPHYVPYHASLSFGCDNFYQLMGPPRLYLQPKTHPTSPFYTMTSFSSISTSLISLVTYKGAQQDVQHCLLPLTPVQR